MEPLTPIDFYFAGPDVEGPHDYRPGGYHPVHLGDVYCQRYKVIHKLGFGTYSTVWLARDLQSTAQSRYVALKFAVAELSGRNNEIEIHRHLASRLGIAHPGSDRVLALLDHFKVKGPNGEHDVLVLQVVGPHLEVMFNDDPAVVQQAIKSLVHQVVLGISFLHDRGVVHADLHKGNVAFEIPSFDGRPEEDTLMALGPPEIVAVIARDHLRQTDSLPKYLVLPGNLVECVKQDDLRVKIIDLGEAFLGGNVPPTHLHTPLQVRAPEIIFNRLSMLLKIDIGTRIDVWSIGCLAYELATSDSLTGIAHDEVGALRELLTLIGPLPNEWVDSLGAPPTRTHVESLEQRIRSISEVDDTPGLTALLEQVLVLEPLRRPGVLDLLNHPWFVDPSNPVALAP